MTDPEGVTPPPGGEEPGGEGGPGGEESGGEEPGGEEPGGEGEPGGEEPGGEGGPGGEEPGGEGGPGGEGEPGGEEPGGEGGPGGEGPGGEEPGGEEPGGEEPGGEEPGGATGCSEEPGTVFEAILPWQQAELMGGQPGSNSLSLFVSVAGAVGRVELSIDLFEGTEDIVGGVGGALAGGIAPGTYPLEGADLDRDSCSICVYAFGDANDWNAAGGTLTIEEIDLVAGGAFRMSLTGVTLAGTNFEGEPLSGCTVSLADTTMEGVFVK